MLPPTLAVSHDEQGGALRLDVELLRRRLAGHAPRWITAPGTRAGVLVPLHAGLGGEARVWLLRRPEHLRTHRGQVALPGGKHEPGDADLVGTALREAWEEIGLAATSVEVVGRLDDLVTVTGYVITPVVGWVSAPFTPTPDPVEVARVFSAPLAMFAVEGRLAPAPLPGPTRLLVPVYEVDGEIVWGATASILGELARKLAHS